MPDAPFDFTRRLGDAQLSVRERIHAMFTRSNLWFSLRTFAWIAPLTLLIWFNAASRTRQTVPNARLQLDLRTNDPNLLIEIEDPGDGVVFATADGPDQALTALTSDSKVSITLTESIKPGRQTLNTHQLLSAATRIKGSGISLSNERPDTIRIKVDAFVEREVPIRMPANVTNVDLEKSEFSPSKVKLRGPSDLIASAEAEGTLFVEADVQPAQFVEPGRKRIEALKLRSRFGQNVTITPDTVAAVLEVRQTDEKLVVPSMNVFVPLPPRVTDQFKVTVQPELLQNVTLWGPPEQIAAIKQNSELAFAQLSLSPKDSASPPIGQARKAPIVFVLPDRVRVDKADLDRIGQAEWSVQRREGGG